MTLDLTEAQVNLIVQMSHGFLQATGVQHARDVVALLDRIQASADEDERGARAAAIDAAVKQALAAKEAPEGGQS